MTKPASPTPTNTPADMLQDKFGRRFPYLRLSITDVCNFRCSYCLPNGYHCTTKPTFLTRDEIGRVVDAFAALGVYKIRLTGGEPTTRKDFTQIAEKVSAHPAITHRAFTTNGYRLHSHAQQWREAGLTHVNVSIDSLNADRFHEITGHARLPDVMQGVETALHVGFTQVKINVVLLKGVNDHELPAFFALAQSLPISIRFIELMQTGDNLDYFRKYHISAQTIGTKLAEQGWKPKPRGHADGPAQIYTHADYQGTMGLIAPYAKDFCAGCNRLRVTATGDLRLCLFGTQGVSLRHLLQHDAQQPLLRKLISTQLDFKRSAHFLADGDTGITPHLASIGG